MAHQLYEYTAVVLKHEKTQGNIVLIYCPPTQRIVAGTQNALIHKDIGLALSELLMTGWKEVKREVI